MNTEKLFEIERALDLQWLAGEIATEEFSGALGALNTLIKFEMFGE